MGSPIHEPGPWRCLRAETSDYYVFRIEVTDGHIASVPGWRDVATTCPITQANARLIEHAPDMADALRALLDWASMMGGWDAPCWRHAEHVLCHATQPDRPDGAATPHR